MTLLQAVTGPPRTRRRSPWVVLRGALRSPWSTAGRVVLLGASAGWVVMLRPVPSAPADAPAPGVHHHHGAGAAPFPGPDAAAGWLLMVVAMMWPLVVPAADAVVRASYRAWRVPLAATCVMTFTGLWLLVGVVALAATWTLSVDPAATWWVVGWLAVAVAGTWSARRNRLLSRCGRHPVLAPGGRRGLVSAARAGGLVWARCALLCGPVMLAMLGGHLVVLMVCASLAVWWEAWHPRAWRDPVPAGLLVAGAAVTLLTGGVLHG